MPFSASQIEGSVTHIRVIAPSRSLAIVQHDQIARAQARLGILGFQVSLGRHVWSGNSLENASVEDRLSDFLDAIRDEKVDIVMSAIGGFSSAELIPHLNFSEIGATKKLFCGFSDVSVLLNNITLRSGLITICGPHFSTFGNDRIGSYIEKSFLKAISARSRYEVDVPASFGDETWPYNYKWKPHANHGPKTLIGGHATGICLGGNVVSLVGNLSFPSEIENLLLFFEIHSGYTFRDFLRWAQAILRAIPRGVLRGVLIGKFPFDMRISGAEEAALIEVIRRFCDGPLVTELDFGHNVPFFSFPLGAISTLDALGERPRLFLYSDL